MLWFVAVLVAAILFGWLENMREKSHRARKWNLHRREMNFQCKLVAGLTRDDVEHRWGTPTRRKCERSERGDEEVWYYDYDLDYYPDVVTFVDGKVSDYTARRDGSCPCPGC